MRSDRLLKLAAYLKLVPRKAFDIRFWENKPATKPEGKKLGECGFSGCAMGWAAHGRLFRGLTLEDGSEDGGSELYYRPKTGEKSGRTFYNYEAPVNLFGIDESVAHLLFSPNYNSSEITPQQVATNIRNFVKERDPKAFAKWKAKNA